MKAITTKLSAATSAGTANSDITVVSAIPLLRAKPIRIGATTVPIRPTLFAQPMPSARMASGMKDCPIDAAIVGIVDAVDVAAGD